MNAIIRFSLIRIVVLFKVHLWIYIAEFYEEMGEESSVAVKGYKIQPIKSKEEFINSDIHIGIIPRGKLS